MTLVLTEAGAPKRRGHSPLLLWFWLQMMSLCERLRWTDTEIYYWFVLRAAASNQWRTKTEDR